MDRFQLIYVSLAQFVQLIHVIRRRFLIPVNRMSQRAQLYKILYRFSFHSLYAWGCPLAIVIIGQVIDTINDIPPSFKIDFGNGTCLLPHNQPPAFIYFFGPVAAILISNLIFFILTAIEIHKVRINSSTTSADERNKQKYWRILY